MTEPAAKQPADPAAVLLARRRARKSLTDFVQAVDIPGTPLREDDSADWLFQPVESTVAAHHRLFMDEIQACITQDYGRLMLFAPPGAAKSSYASVAAPTWAMGRTPGFRVVSCSYAARPAERSSRRCRALATSRKYRAIFGTGLVSGSGSVQEWELENGSGMLSAGILGAVTSARADLLNIDDPVAGREEADSETVQSKTMQAYKDDLLTRLKPRASVVLTQTRWHMNDLAGSLLPEDYDGRSGVIRCRDGADWRVMCLPARADREDDPLGRAVGDYLWPEWFDARHWQTFENDPGASRTWAALYQQQPVPDSGGQFEREWFKFYRPSDVPARLNIYGSSDYAVTEKRGDWTEHGIAGVDCDAGLWLLDGWHGRENSENSLLAFERLRRQWKPLTWFGERGVIESAIGPARERMMRDSLRDGIPATMVELLPVVGDKVARVASFRARARIGMVHMPDTPWGHRVVDQLCSFPMGRHDDAVDMCGLFGRGLDAVWAAGRSVRSVDKLVESPYSYAGLLAEMKRGAVDDEVKRAYFN